MPELITAGSNAGCADCSRLRAEVKRLKAELARENDGLSVQLYKNQSLVERQERWQKEVNAARTLDEDRWIKAEARAERLEKALEKDQAGLVVALGKVRTEAKARLWVVDGRGSYEWDDEHYRKETGIALTAIVQLADKALRDSGDIVLAALADQPAKEGEKI